MNFKLRLRLKTLRNSMIVVVGRLRRVNFKFIDLIVLKGMFYG